MNLEVSATERRSDEATKGHPGRPSSARALVALALLVPAPTIGALMMLRLAPGPVGSAAAGVCKVWILLLPVAWLALVDRGRPAIPRLTRSGLLPAIALGLATMAVMLLAYHILGRRWIDVALVRERAARMHIDTPLAYALLFGFLILLNSLLEEYVWRWFVFSRCAVLVGPTAAVFAAAGLFTVHHVFALSAWVPWHLNLLGSLGVFTGGAVWTWLYRRYRSIWSAYVCHVFADVAIFVIGWDLILSRAAAAAG